MNWQEFFSEISDVLQTTLPDQPTWVPMPDYRLILVEGPDAITFLQGQCTCDFTQLARSQILLGAHCNPKGRVHSSFGAAAIAPDKIALRVHHSIAQDALSALQKYAVFSKAALSVLDQYALFSIIGPGAKTNVEQLLGQTPVIEHFHGRDELCLLHHEQDMFEIWCPWNTLATIDTSHCSWSKDSNLWRLTNIRRGIADVRAEIQEQLIPQEMNMQFNGGVSFDKGCYTGQEIVARLHYRGQLKKHMYRGKVALPSSPKSGTAIYMDADTQKPAGLVINAAESEEDNVYEVLALVSSERLSAGTCVTALDLSSEITWLSLPYAIN